MTHQFSQVPKAQIPRSSFDRSHTHKTTFDGGYLIPILVDEALPGDTFNLKMTGFARLATPIFPAMDNMHMETFFFFVPNRLLWQNWEKFNGAQDNPADSTDFTIPILPANPWAENSIADYMGVPIDVAGALQTTFNSLHFRAYNLIWNEWFRDQNLQDSVAQNVGDGPDVTNNYNLLRRGKRHDYFTSALPWPQKGDPVSIPISGTAPITGLGISGTNPPAVAGGYANALETDGSLGTGDGWIFGTALNTKESTTTLGQPAIYADLSQATTTTINSLRQAFQIQKLLERDARGGTRYTEIIRAHFGVTSPDARLQRPEYLGGGSSRVNITPVASTVPTDVGITTPQGALAGYGTAVLNNHGFTKSFTEHGVIIGLLSVRADLTYQQGLDRMWSRQTRFDYYWPALAHLGEQEILNQEIFYSNDPVERLAVFGYQERYAEYRYKPSKITGQFRSSAAATLDAWHLSQDFASLPVLDAAFIEDTPPIDRIVAVPAEPHFLFDSYFSMRCARPMPLYGVPGLIDHF